MQKPPEEVIVVAPTYEATKVDPKDSTYLRITLTWKEYKISLLNDSLRTTSVKGIDDFISNNQTHINGNNIILTGIQNPNFNSLKEVLKKHKYFKFRITTDGE